MATLTVRVVVEIDSPKGATRLEKSWTRDVGNPAFVPWQIGENGAKLSREVAEMFGDPDHRPL